MTGPASGNPRIYADRAFLSRQRARKARIRPERDQLELDQTGGHQGQLGQPALGLLHVGTLEHQDRTGAIGAEIDLPDHILLYQAPGRPRFTFQQRHELVRGCCRILYFQSQDAHRSLPS